LKLEPENKEFKLLQEQVIQEIKADHMVEPDADDKARFDRLF
jgi:hypothetical protein